MHEPLQLASGLVQRDGLVPEPRADALQQQFLTGSADRIRGPKNAGGGNSSLFVLTSTEIWHFPET